MNWDAIGALAEAMGALAVIGSNNATSGRSSITSIWISAGITRLNTFSIERARSTMWNGLNRWR